MSAVESKSEYLRRAKRTREPGGHALCHDAIGRRRHYAVCDASKTGIALGDGPALPIGSTVQIELSWPDVGRATVEAVVCRHGQGRARMALQTTREHGMAELLSNLFVLESMRERDPHILICGDGPLSAKAEAELTAAGIPTRRASSALDVIHTLQDPWSLTTALTFETHRRWLELSAFIGEEFPELHRTLLIDPSANQLSRVGPSYAEAVLYGPWKRDALLEALDLHMSGEHCLSCASPLASTASPFCAPCLDWSRNVDALDDLGCWD